MKEYEVWFGKFNIEIAQSRCEANLWTWLIVTDGENGIHVVSKDSYKHIKGDAIEVSDVSGAGDTVLAIIAHYSQFKDIPNACELANKGAQKVVQRRGVSIVSKTDIEDVIVWTNGVFDILHTGHFELLKFAKQQGNILIVGINSDTSVKKLKGKNRPYNNSVIRKQQLLELPWVDKVVVFKENTPIESIKAIKPDIIVKGGDYTLETTVGNELADVRIFPTVKGFSTSVYSELNTASALLFPSLKEGMPNVLVEAMAIGLPIVQLTLLVIDLSSVGRMRKVLFGLTLGILEICQKK